MRTLLVVLLLVAAPAAGQEWGIEAGRYGGYWYRSRPEPHASPGQPYGMVGYGYRAPRPYAGYGYELSRYGRYEPRLFESWRARIARWRQRSAEVVCSYDHRCRR